MLTRWPARVSRPYKTKLDPVLPLITGMRIIDTLFPIAKGGTGAIPGAFGTGKCLLPGTPVLLGSGRLVPIERIFKRVKGGDPDTSVDEEIYEVYQQEISVYSFNGRNFVRMPVSHVYRGRSDRIVRIRTGRGRVFEVTPAHKLLVFDPEKGFVEVPAISIRKGDLITVPRKITLETRASLNLYKYIPEAVVRDRKIVEEFSRLAQKISRERNLTLTQIALEIGVDPRRFLLMVEGFLNPPLHVVEKVYKMARLKPPHPEKISRKGDRHNISIPKEIEGDFAYVLGLIAAGGIIRSIEGKDVLSIQLPADLLDQRSLLDLIDRVFDPRPRSIRWISASKLKDHLDRRIMMINISSRVLIDLMNRIGITANEISKRKIPSIIMRSSDNALEYFLAGYFRVLGYYRNSRIYLMSFSKTSRDRLSYILTRIGIGYRFEEIIQDPEKKIYLIVIEKPYDLILFSEKILSKDPLSRGVLSYDKYVGILRSEIEKFKNEITRKIPLKYLSIPEEVFLRITERSDNIATYVASANEGEQVLLLKRVLKEESKEIENLAEVFKVVDVDPVVDIEIIEGDWIVYDITVPGTHNFVGGFMPSIYHNTVTLHSLAMWSDARVVIYIGCGERGNEMTEVLERFPQTKDPWTGRPLMERTILIANTSNMPVSAREASIYVGVTIGEYYRDLGYDVLLVADSTSRWAEALREISGRLEEMPAEEGYPSYLQSRIAEFYERAGRVIALGRPERTGSVTIIGAVSPPGGDFTEPVTTHTRRFIRVFWALDASLAYSRHYPAINWITSYSAYTDLVSEWWAKEVDPSWRSIRDQIMNILLRENELREVIRLVGSENLPESDKLIVEVARMIKDGFLRQNAYDPIDAFSSPAKQFKLMKLLIVFYENAKALVESGYSVRSIKDKIQSIITEMVKARFTVENERLDKLDELERRLLKAFEELRGASR
ncbi:MAG: V-type ATP synthase subunit A [Sulfolobales archaeon]